MGSPRVFRRCTRRPMKLSVLTQLVRRRPTPRPAIRSDGTALRCASPPAKTEYSKRRLPSYTPCLRKSKPTRRKLTSADMPRLKFSDRLFEKVHTQKKHLKSLCRKRRVRFTAYS